ncbi:dihydrofolate reductase family protein [Actinoplanes sp. HUAS TT8]|uniref:dihydrofolate reductase family protein n=1 Tax=Actinoplanes sp. HUAS TT8 TaxID=3447453 RepID=UPI003F528478
MARLICTGITSLDGYINDEQGNFDWSVPDEEVHSFVNDLERPIGTYLYGRRLYEVMRFWEDAQVRPDSSPAAIDYAQLWRAAEKIVYSTTLEAATTARTRIERSFDPKAVQALKDAADRDLSVGGPHLAAHAFRAGLVDEVQLFVSPVVVGGGTRFLPSGVRLDLKLAEQRRFANGVVYLRYQAG